MCERRWTDADIAALPAWTLVQAYHPVARRFHEIFAAEQLTPVQFGVLVQLSANPGVSQADLARTILVRQQSMAELLSALTERGLLTRDIENRHGRSVPLHLTAEGRQALQRAGAAVVDFNTTDRLGLTESEASTLNTLLHKVINASKHW
ncbi:MarR family winged helix-turn-helix transcriptional regulator [Williamsia sterculiae]|uniref:DNA-binding transcriptional regulator, MarR family n=1 Tax=Williamsia sterculiae TaxID=1344003 RepID=A0A1N7DJD2_9NOCA|nr:MarR family transcriptional regulator [Williamsia sterculiae]SIR75904.1 DNA-binding transcriptional regulator, MarR family [Williamsia sterculiae]